MTVAVIGSGEEWLSLALKFAAAGLHTRAITRKGEVLEALSEGTLPRSGFPPTAHRLLASARAQQTFEALEQVADAEGCESIVLAPQLAIDRARREVSLGPLGELFDQLTGHINPGSLVVVACRIPPGTMMDFVKPRLERSSGQQAFVGVLMAAVPERVHGAELFEWPERYNRVVGRVDPVSAKRAVDLYKRISRGELDLCDIHTASLVAASEGAILETQRALSLELALACDAFGASPSRVRELLKKSPHGGLDLPRAEAAPVTPPDDATLLRAATHNRLRLPLMDAASTVVNSAPRVLARLAQRALKRARKDPKFSTAVVLGLAAHPNTADTSGAPALILLEELRALGFQSLHVHDPYVRHPGSMDSIEDLQVAMRGADLLALATPHDVYLAKTADFLSVLSAGAIVIDARGAIPRAEVQRRGLVYVGLAR
jgi:nucleotide sugar dehydrogenase